MIRELAILSLLYTLIIGTATGPECNACLKTVSTIIPPTVKNHFFSSFFGKAACDRITGISDSDRLTCHTYVENNAKVMVDWIERGLAGMKLCTLLKKCGDDPKLDCDFCMKSGPKIQEVLGETLLHHSFDDLADSFCSKHASVLGLSTTEDCGTFMRKFKSEVMTLANSNDFTPTFCKLFEFCPAS
ncbi:hypothetical protein RCL1_004328 [Eukaryota sp. TZLM3-RCL]